MRPWRSVGVGTQTTSAASQSASRLTLPCAYGSAAMTSSRLPSSATKNQATSPLGEAVGDLRGAALHGHLVARDLAACDRPPGSR